MSKPKLVYQLKVMNDSAMDLGSAGFGLMFFIPSGTILLLAMPDHDKTIHLKKNIFTSLLQ